MAFTRKDGAKKAPSKRPSSGNPPVKRSARSVGSGTSVKSEANAFQKFFKKEKPAEVEKDRSYLNENTMKFTSYGTASKKTTKKYIGKEEKKSSPPEAEKSYGPAKLFSDDYFLNPGGSKSYDKVK
jgi:hypothetical protein